jgi:glutathione S-transferase
MHHQAALITLLTVVVIIIAMMMVGRARGKYKIKAPATTGHPDFDRAFRAHQNTIEQAVIFLPVLWLASIYSYETYAAYVGYAWVISRLWFIFAYIAEAEKRGIPFGLSSLASAILLGMGAWGLLNQLMM